MARRNNAIALYGAAVAILIVGGVLAARPFPGGFDWSYTVVSALMSRKHNPEGGMWFSAALAVSMLLLLHVSAYLDGQSAPGRRPRVSLAALRFGLACGVVLGVERFFIFHLSDVVRKAHEALAILTFIGVYWGVVGLYLNRIRTGVSAFWPLLVVFPLLAVGLGKLGLYFEQRAIGWADVAWREMGAPIWLSFAFWQWIAVALLYFGVGHLVAAGGERGRARSRPAATFDAVVPERRLGT